MLNHPQEAQKRAELKRWQAYMLALLLAAAGVFLTCSWWQAGHAEASAWIGYVRAAAEAGMVGGLADWFAVTALFKYPLGLRIPHTALIPNNKDKVGHSLGAFVEEKFLTRDNLTELVRREDLPAKAANYLVGERGAQWVAAEGAKLIRAAVRNVSAEQAAEFIHTQVFDRLREPEWGPPAGRLLESYISAGKARPLEDDLITWAHTQVLGMETQVIKLVDEKMPDWLPRFARGLAGDKVYAALVEWAGEVMHDPNHDARLALRRALAKFAQDLQHDPQLIARVEGIKEELFSSTQMQQAPAQLWATVATTVIAQTGAPDSYLRTKLADLARSLGQRILDDAPFRAKLQSYVESATEFAVDNYASTVIEIIPATIAKWPAEEAARVIELQVGKDLQFIRLNGTVVGALAGLAIYTVNELIF